MHTLKSLSAFVAYILVSLFSLWVYPHIIEYCAVTLGDAAYVAGGYCYILLMATIFIGFLGMVLTLLNSVLHKFRVKPAV